MRHKLFAAALLLFLLAGCQSGGGEVPSQPEPVQPEGPAVREIVEWLADETHHQFRLGHTEMWVTMKLLPDQRIENGEQEIRVDVWNLKNLDEPKQTIRDYIEGYVFGRTQVVDANFDGRMDFGYMRFAGNQPTYWNFWLWDEETGCFVAEPGLSEISDPGFHWETETISGWQRNSAAADGTSTIHKWVDGELVCVRRIEVFPKEGGPGPDTPMVLTVEDRVDGELTEVFRTEFPAGSGGYFSERMKWEDINYHGEDNKT